VHPCFHLWNFFVFFQHFQNVELGGGMGMVLSKGAHQSPWNALSQQKYERKNPQKALNNLGIN